MLCAINGHMKGNMLCAINGHYILKGTPYVMYH